MSVLATLEVSSVMEKGLMFIAEYTSFFQASLSESYSFSCAEACRLLPRLGNRNSSLISHHFHTSISKSLALPASSQVLRRMTCIEAKLIYMISCDRVHDLEIFMPIAQRNQALLA